MDSKVVQALARPALSCGSPTLQAWSKTKGMTLREQIFFLFFSTVAAPLAVNPMLRRFVRL